MKRERVRFCQALASTHPTWGVSTHSLLWVRFAAAQISSFLHFVPTFETALCIREGTDAAGSLSPPCGSGGPDTWRDESV